MKKTIISAIVLTFALGCIQYEYAEAQHLPSSGDRTFEVTVSPFTGVPVIFNEVRFRMFRSPDSALRLRTNITYESDRFDDDTRDMEFSLALAPGMEWHAIRRERIAVYYGAEIPISYRTSQQEYVWAGDDIVDKNTIGNEHFGIGVMGVTGFDIHFLGVLYTGAEVRYGFMYRSFLDQEVRGDVFRNDGSDFVFGPQAGALGRFRLGFTF